MSPYCVAAWLPRGYLDNCPTPYTPPLTPHPLHPTPYTPPLTPHLFLPKMTIITNNDRDIPPRFRQAVTNAVGNGRDCYAQFEYSCKQQYYIVKIFWKHADLPAVHWNTRSLVESGGTVVPDTTTLDGETIKVNILLSYRYSIQGSSSCVALGIDTEEAMGLETFQSCCTIDVAFPCMIK